MAETCVNCGDPRMYAKDRCRPCYAYRQVKGVDRSEALFVRQAVAEFELEQLRRIVRRAVLREESA